MTSFTVALVQHNYNVGDITGNAARIAAAYRQAAAQGADMVITPEMALTGYPPEDLVLRPEFQHAAEKAVHNIVLEVKGQAALLFGGISTQGASLYNSVFFIAEQQVQSVRHKHCLPNYGVFDEKRIFSSGPLPQVLSWKGIRWGVLICEDMWTEHVAKHLCNQGAQCLLSVHASPFDVGKSPLRLAAAKARVQETHVPLCYVNQVGGQDELVFDGESFVLSGQGEILHRANAFKEEIRYVTLTLTQAGVLQVQPGEVVHGLEKEAALYGAMVCGLRDYVEKNGFPGVILGMSGGIDSALSAAIAVDALGPSRVQGVMLPSPYTSQESIDDAVQCAKNLNITLRTIPIDTAMQAVAQQLESMTALNDIAQQNIQSRLRGLLLMAISNSEGWMLLTTGNKSEMAVGYATLYGDMCGGFNALKDLYKTDVYHVAHWRNIRHRVIPERIFTKAPSAELKPDQTDQDSLPPYAVLDAILTQLIEEELGVEEIVARGGGGDRATVEKVAKLVALSEHKRRQAPPGMKLGYKAFGRDRRYPITSGWRFSAE